MYLICTRYLIYYKLVCLVSIYVHYLCKSTNSYHMWIQFQIMFDSFYTDNLSLKTVIKDNLVPLSIGIKTNFNSIPHLCDYWLNIVEVRGGVHHLLQGWIVLNLTTPFLIHFKTVCHDYEKHHRIPCFFVPDSEIHCKYFLNVNQASLGSLLFYLLCLIPYTFLIIPVLNGCFLSVCFLFFIYNYNYSSGIL